MKTLAERAECKSESVKTIQNTEPGLAVAGAKAAKVRLRVVQQRLQQRRVACSQCQTTSVQIQTNEPLLHGKASDHTQVLT